MVSQVLQNLQDAIRVNASDQGLHRVESRNRYVPMGFRKRLWLRRMERERPILQCNAAEGQTVAACRHSVKIVTARSLSDRLLGCRLRRCAYNRPIVFCI